jgi:hypothetical protein
MPFDPALYCRIKRNTEDPRKESRAHQSRGACRLGPRNDNAHVRRLAKPVTSRELRGV